MGSYCSLSINDYEIDSSKSYIDPFMSLIFHERDKRIRRIHFSKHYTEPIEENTELVDCIEYSVNKVTLKDRLELLGYSLEKSILEYDNFLEEIIAQYKECEFEEFDGFRYFNELKSQGFIGWLKLFEEILNKGVSKYEQIEQKDRLNEKDLEYYILDHTNEELLLGFPGSSYGLALRAIVEVMEESDELVLDITSLVYAGYYFKDQEVCLNTAQSSMKIALPYQKILILTEGSSDTQILSKSLKLLYPHLEDYFSFLDFSGSGIDGGTPALERTVRSFSASGINNKIIALFDNDTAGRSSMMALGKTKLSSNIRLLSLPDLEFAKSFPTIGAQGIMDADINGRACSLELYLGQNILKDEEGLWFPVKWGGLDARLNNYQGEITNKSKIQGKFKEIINKIENSMLPLDAHSWEEMKLIFKIIFDTASAI